MEREEAKNSGCNLLSNMHSTICEETKFAIYVSFCSLCTLRRERFSSSSSTCSLLSLVYSCKAILYIVCEWVSLSLSRLHSGDIATHPHTAFSSFSLNQCSAQRKREREREDELCTLMSWLIIHPSVYKMCERERGRERRIKAQANSPSVFYFVRFHSGWNEWQRQLKLPHAIPCHSLHGHCHIGANKIRSQCTHTLTTTLPLSLSLLCATIKLNLLSVYCSCLQNAFNSSLYKWKHVLAHTLCLLYWRRDRSTIDLLSSSLLKSLSCNQEAIIRQTSESAYSSSFFSTVILSEDVSSYAHDDDWVFCFFPLSLFSLLLSHSSDYFWYHIFALSLLLLHPSFIFFHFSLIVL